MNVLRFNSHTEMQAYLIRAQADADMALHPAQRAITWGSHWVRFVDLGRRIVEFGRVYQPDEVVDLEVQYGATAREAASAVDATKRGLEAGYLYGLAFSVYNHDGEAGHTHKAHAWPIEESLFNAAAETHWQIDLMPVSAKINLHAAFTAFRTREV